jgi:hypothetical protein
MAQQTILFTVMPRGVSVNAATLPVSVLVSPRLVGASTLGKFPDWLGWTQQLKEDGLQLTFRCGASTLTLPVDRTPLHPELWLAMFDENTYVRSHTFKDYTRRAIFSYPTRLALSSIKSMYQEASLALGLPDQSGQKDQRESSYRQFLKACSPAWRSTGMTTRARGCARLTVKPSAPWAWRETCRPPITTRAGWRRMGR